MKYGYARVSTDGQSVEAQVRQLTKAGCKKDALRNRLMYGIALRFRQASPQVARLTNVLPRYLPSGRTKAL